MRTKLYRAFARNVDFHIIVSRSERTYNFRVTLTALLPILFHCEDFLILINCGSPRNNSHVTLLWNCRMFLWIQKSWWKLRNKSKLFVCDCSREELHELKAVHTQCGEHASEQTTLIQSLQSLQDQTQIGIYCWINNCNNYHWTIDVWTRCIWSSLLISLML